MIPEIHYKFMSQEEIFNLAKEVVLKLNIDNRKRLSDCLEGMRYVKVAAESSTGNRAATMESLIRPLTLHAIRNVARSKRVDPENECELMYECLLAELSEDIAQHFLNHLRAIDQPIPFNDEESRKIKNYLDYKLDAIKDNA